MDPVLKLVIEAACLIGIVVLAAVSTVILGGKRWDRLMWIRSAGVLVVGLVYFVVNPRGAPDIFPVVIGSTAFVVVVVGLMLALTLAWRFAHPERRSEIDRQASTDFGGMGLFGLAAAACPGRRSVLHCRHRGRGGRAVCLRARPELRHILVQFMSRAD